MTQYTIYEIADACHGRLVNDQPLRISRLLTDSRLLFVSDDTLFIAIKGPRHDGARYIADLYDRGIRAFLCNEGTDVSRYPDATFIMVPDTVAALGQIAAMHRQKMKCTVVAVIGSNGKTIVKEWIADFICETFRTVRSPRSYNSQVGVPLSLWNIEADTQVAVIEAGISKPGEMAKLEEMVRPDIVVITNIGSAHQENFDTIEQKLNEKLVMCRRAKSVVYNEENELIDEAIKNRFPNITRNTWYMSIERTDDKTNEELYKAGINYTNREEDEIFDSAKNENVENARVCAIVLGVDPHKVNDHIKDLPLIDMRMLQRGGHNNCTIINDSYSADMESTAAALDLLYTLGHQEGLSLTVILSDIQQTGLPNDELYGRVGQLLQEKGINRLIGIGLNIKASMEGTLDNALFFDSTDDFLNKMSTADFANEAILIKGCRSFGFERIADNLEDKWTRTEMRINLDALAHNIAYYRSLLQPQTKLLAMVKAYSYGTGSFEIAKLMQNQGVDYLGVAFADEGYELRKAGITLPIIVMNPEPHSYNMMIEYNLEPQINNFDSLSIFAATARDMGLKEVAFHLKFNTGMNRSGFNIDEIDEMMRIIDYYDNIVVRSVFSHLAGSDEDCFDDFTIEQINKFDKICELLYSKLGYKFDRHILNSAGIERFAEHQYEMVRLGIGLYGYGFTPEAKRELRNVCTLKSYISQTRNVKAGESIGYSRKTICTRPTTLAIVPIGYADGIDRRLSNGVGEVIINGHRAPILGNVCMDICMVDITDVPYWRLDAEVILFGDDNPVWEMSDKIGTIPYEILTGISRRVKRVYFVE